MTAGETLEPFVVALTLQRLSMEAAANRDFNPIHIESETGRASGAPDAFANTTLIETLLEAVVRDGAGLGAHIAVLEFSMLGFNAVGDRLTVGGEVREVADGRAEVDVWIDGPRGRTVTGTATVVLAA